MPIAKPSVGGFGGLFHWREYASEGVAIGFSGKHIAAGFHLDISRRISGARIESPIRPDPANRLMRCRYFGSCDLAELVADRLFGTRNYPVLFRQLGSDGMFNSLLAVSIYQLICTIKRPHFSPDNEWRTVHIDPRPIDYPVQFENGRPFIELRHSPKEFVKEIWVGPHKSSGVCNSSVAELLDAGLLRCSVLQSTRNPDSENAQ